MDWTSAESHVVLNPRLAAAVQDRIARAIQDVAPLPAHLWVMSSGTTSETKIIALSKTAFLAAADAANQHLRAMPEDVWLNVLPKFHVGGLSIFARSYLVKNHVVDASDKKWSVSDFLRTCEAENITLTSLVPTQVVDLIKAKAVAPQMLRAVVIGGGALSPEHYYAARKLGWPCLPSFGMTECCSQIATAPMASLDSKAYPHLKLLPHIRARLAPDGRLEIQSAALASGILFLSDSSAQFKDPKTDGWFRTQDLVELTNDQNLKPLGRRDDCIKILGELVNLYKLEQKLRTSCDTDICLVALTNQRRGFDLAAVCAKPSDLAQVERDLFRLNNDLLPFERIHLLIQVDELPKTELGKIRKSRLVFGWRGSA